MAPPPRSMTFAIVAAMWLTAAAGAAAGQNPPAGPLAVPARQWASEAAMNELTVINYGHVYLRYREHSIDAKGDHVRDVIESKDGTVARLIVKDGRPLTPEEDQGERERLQAMLDSPSAFAKHVKGDASAKKVGSEMIKLVPNAMIFTYTPGQPQRSTRQTQPDEPPEIVIDFKPDPAWTPPNIEAEALIGLEGRIWIDARTHFLTRMEGTVFRPVNFGLFLAHVYPGGKLTFEQVRVSAERWIFSHFTEHVNVRVLFKSLKEDSDMEGSDFTAIQAMSYQDAIHTLLATPLPAH